MKIFLVYAHPHQDSYHHALKEHAITTLKNNHHEVKISDLYAMNFKATADWQDFTSNTTQELSHQYSVAQKIAFEKNLLSSDIQTEMEKLKWCDVLILQFPFWWFSVPAILKGWFDRVLVKGFTYDAGQWFNTAPLLGRKAMIMTTTQAPAQSYLPNALNGDINSLLQPIHHTLHFIGFTPIEPFIAYGVMDEDNVKRKRYLEEYAEHLLNLEHATILPIPII